MLHIAIIEKQTIAKELVYQIGQVLHDYAWNFTHYTSLVDFAKQEPSSSFEVVFLNTKFQSQRIFDSIIKDKPYTVIYTSLEQLETIVYPELHYINLEDIIEVKRRLQELLIPIVKRQEEIYFSYQNVNIMVKIKDIQYIEKQDKFLIYHTKLGEFKQRGNMNDAVNFFKMYGFLHIHMSFLVNEVYIFGLHQDNLMLKDKTELPISRSKYRKVKLFFENKQFNKR